MSYTMPVVLMASPALSFVKDKTPPKIYQPKDLANRITGLLFTPIFYGFLVPIFGAIGAVFNALTYGYLQTKSFCLFFKCLEKDKAEFEQAKLEIQKAIAVQRFVASYLMLIPFIGEGLSEHARRMDSYLSREALTCYNRYIESQA